MKNPNVPEEDPLREPSEIMAEIVALDAESAEILSLVSAHLDCARCKPLNQR